MSKTIKERLSNGLSDIQFYEMVAINSDIVRNRLLRPFDIALSQGVWGAREIVSAQVGESVLELLADE